MHATQSKPSTPQNDPLLRANSLILQELRTQTGHLKKIREYAGWIAIPCFLVVLAVVLVALAFLVLPLGQYLFS